MSPRMRIVNAGTPGTPPSGGGILGSNIIAGHTGMSISHGLTTSLSQPIYVPGKYSVSFIFIKHFPQALITIFFMCSHPVVSVIRKRMKFMGLGMEYLVNK